MNIIFLRQLYIAIVMHLHCKIKKIYNFRSTSNNLRYSTKIAMIVLISSLSRVKPLSFCVDGKQQREVSVPTSLQMLFITNLV